MRCFAQRESIDPEQRCRTKSAVAKRPKDRSLAFQRQGRRRASFSLPFFAAMRRKRGGKVLLHRADFRALKRPATLGCRSATEESSANCQHHQDRFLRDPHRAINGELTIFFTDPDKPDGVENPRKITSGPGLVIQRGIAAAKGN